MNGVFPSRISSEIAQRGYCIESNFLRTADLEALRIEHSEWQQAQRFRETSIGRGDETQVNPEIRRDRSAWFEPQAPTPAQKIFLERLEEIRTEVNRTLFLGLRSLEAHYALYEEGAFYRRHRDAFRDNDARVLSAILYLNSEWKKEDGGELVLYTPEPLRIEPRAGNLVLFLSRDFEHEVLPTTVPRLSIAGWFRQ